MGGVPAAQAWYDRGRAGTLGSPSAALGHIPQCDVGLGSDAPWSFYQQGYIEAHNNMPPRQLSADEVDGYVPAQPAAPAGKRAQGSEARSGRPSLWYWALAFLLLG